MKRFYLFGILILLLMVCSQCKDEPAIPMADFTIERDTIINDKKVRIEVDRVNINQPVFLVSKTDAMFNSVWPGDSLKSGKISVYHDYDLSKSTVNLLPTSKTDSTMLMKTTSYQGLPLPAGTVELAYTFKSKGILKITWIATNCTSSSCVSAKIQKTITVQ